MGAPAPIFHFMIEKVNIDSSEKVDLLVNSIGQILSEAFGASTPKSKIKVGRERLNFACPYCGDSHDKVHKKRGNLFLDSLGYHCYNCNTHRTLRTLLKDFNKLPAEWSKMTQLAIDSITEISGTRSVDSERLLDALFSKDLIEHLFTREELKNKLGLIEVSDTKIDIYLGKRLQRKKQNFLWDPKESKLYILNIKEDDGLIIGWQVRNFGKYKDNGAKYLTYKWSKACDILDKEASVENADLLDKLSYTFNIFNVDFTKSVTVFEGPLDSFLFPNSIALSSLHTKIPFENESFRFLFDYDKPGQDKALEFLKEGKTVFLWKNFLKENDIKIKKSKIDWTDVMIYCYLNKKKLMGLHKYFTNNKYDVIYL